MDIKVVIVCIKIVKVSIYDRAKTINSCNSHVLISTARNFVSVIVKKKTIIAIIICLSSNGLF